MKNLNNYLLLLQEGLRNLDSDSLFYSILKESEMPLELNDSQIVNK